MKEGLFVRECESMTTIPIERLSETDNSNLIFCKAAPWFNLFILRLLNFLKNVIQRYSARYDQHSTLCLAFAYNYICFKEKLFYDRITRIGSLSQCSHISDNIIPVGYLPASTRKIKTRSLHNYHHCWR